MLHCGEYLESFVRQYAMLKPLRLAQSMGKQTRGAGRAGGILPDSPPLVPTLPNTKDIGGIAGFVWMFGSMHAHG